MTTGILHMMLYRGAQLIREVEIHYVNDADRGVVCEEVITIQPERKFIVQSRRTFMSFISTVRPNSLILWFTIFNTTTRC